MDFTIYKETPLSEVISLQQIGKFTGLFILLTIGKPIIILFLIGLSIYSINGIKNALTALIISGVVIMLNKGLFALGGVEVTMLRWLVLLIASFSILLKHKKLPYYIWGLLTFVVLASIVSTVWGTMPAVSIFKLISFTIGVTAILIGFYNIRDKTYFTKLFINLYISVLFLSLLVGVLAPNIAYLTSEWSNYNGLKGIMVHPQPFAVYLTVSFCLILSIVIQNKNLNLQNLLLILFSLIGIYLTKARTAIAVIGLVFLLVILISFFNRTWRVVILKISTNYMFVFFILIIILITIFKMSSFKESVTEYLLKGGRNGNTISESLEGSRGFLVKRQISNINTFPYTGIGFGVPSVVLSDFEVVTDPVFGFPIQAETEKGNILIAIIEENGLIVGGLFYFVILTFWREAYDKFNIVSFIVFSACILVNIGEAILFSLGGIGLYVWLLAGFSISKNR